MQSLSRSVSPTRLNVAASEERDLPFYLARESRTRDSEADSPPRRKYVQPPVPENCSTWYITSCQNISE